MTYSYLTRLKAAATWEGLSLSKLQEISQRGEGEGREIGMKRYRGTVRERGRVESEQQRGFLTKLP